MRSQSILAVSAVAFVALFVFALLMARKYGIGIELTRNADANRRAMEQQAHETLQRLAANPRLTVARQALPQDQERSKKAVVLCVISRHIVSLLLKQPDSSQEASESLIERLQTVDVEPASYEATELPALIAGIVAAQNKNPSPALRSDFDELIETLERENDRGSRVVIY